MVVAEEGVIKYQLEFLVKKPVEFERFTALNYWRCYLFRLGLIGQDPVRYEGLGFGNISSRLLPGSPEFLISATQTGHMPLLCRDHYSHVTSYDLKRNWLQAYGRHEPSSEALTHASIYACRPDVNCVMHIHCPRIWVRARELKLPATQSRVAYGTPEMGLAVQALVAKSAAARGVIAMLGHEDGLLVYGASEEDAGAALNELLQHGCS